MTRGGRLVLVAVAAVVVIALAVTAGVLVMRSRSAGSTIDPDHERLSASFAKRPQALWRLKPSAVGASSWGTPMTYYGAREDTGYIVSDGVLVQSARGVAAEKAVTGIDIGTGAVRWRSGPQGDAEAAAYSTGCSPLLAKGRIACGRTGTVSFLATGSGELLGSVPAPTDYHSVIQVGGSLAYVSAGAESLRVTGGDMRSATALDWRIDGPSSDGNLGWESRGDLGAVCRGSIRGSSSVVFDASGAEILPALHDDGCYRLTRKGWVTASSGSRLTIYNGAGKRLFRSSADLRFVEGDRPLGIDVKTGEVFSLPDGARIWSSSMLQDGLGGGTVIGLVDDALLLSVYENKTWTIVALDAADGRLRWKSVGVNGYSVVSDGQRALLLDEKLGLVALDLRDGSRAWTLTEFMGASSSKLVAVGDRLLLVSGEEVAAIGYR
ncbi:PQQ-binding-like beta-propeller repeat protein [Tsukamurella pseudospumae]|uniref:Pyrrolo-quinoline quinone repeat domain-containing protein n=1 Tax=Tsukamurella pseudospumae TaxID=239498 RepID=A0A138AI98_9ACTN|nr:PQQ-binding-like beta-propeller repeat protein [Tsukamurella pseudospumae]KXP10221.1 hypothetical protein AXK60_07050 [Tsukamurella pseudospumae]